MTYQATREPSLNTGNSVEEVNCTPYQSHGDQSTMIIPESSIRPFGYDIPTIVMVRQGTNPALLAKVFRACYDAFRDAIKQWKIMHHCKKNGPPYPKSFIDAKILKLYVIFAGGKNVKCEIEDFEEFFHMDISFDIEGDPTHYGSYLEYPDGENSHREHS